MRRFLVRSASLVLQFLEIGELKLAPEYADLHVQLAPGVRRGGNDAGNAQWKHLHFVARPEVPRLCGGFFCGFFRCVLRQCFLKHLSCPGAVLFQFAHVLSLTVQGPYRLVHLGLDFLKHLLRLAPRFRQDLLASFLGLGFFRVQAGFQVLCLSLQLSDL